MRKIKKVLLAALMIVAALLIPTDSVSAASDYEIQKYDVDIVVNENNTFDITETIDAYFNVEKHGIFRTLPLYNTVKRNDGTTTKNRARITNISVSEPYKVESNIGEMKLKIGDADTVLTGKKSYTIKYNYNIGKDPLEDADEFYYDMIGTQWDTTISDVTFTVHMPKDFDEEKLGFSAGRTGTTNSDKVLYYVSGRTIKGMLVGKLNAGEGLTIRLTLPEGYFVGAGIEVNPINYIAYAVPVVCFMIAFYLWNKYGKDKKTFINPEYEPPKGFNSLEVGFMHKGKADSKDVTSLLIYLANKGYLTIEESEEKALFSKKKSFKLKKIKEYDGTNSEERLFLRGLFKTGDVVTASDLYDDFYKTTNKIINSINKKENKEKIFEKRGKMIAAAWAMVVVSFIAITLPPFIEYGAFDEVPFALIFPGIGFPVLAWGIVSLIVEKGASKIVGVILMFWGAMFGGMPFLMVVLPMLMVDTVFLIGYLVGMVLAIGIAIFAKIMPKRTEYGLEMYAKIEGFKEFLEKVEKERLEKMVEENPKYFYEVLPYTYVLGITDKWVKKFEDINLQAPDWYSGTSTFNAVTFGSFLNSTMASASSSMSSSSSSSSGGGSVGGGSGGGGGGSW